MIPWWVDRGVEGIVEEVALNAVTEDVEENWVKERYNFLHDCMNEVLAPGTPRGSFALEDMVVGFIGLVAAGASVIITGLSPVKAVASR